MNISIKLIFLFFLEIFFFGYDIMNKKLIIILIGIILIILVTIGVLVLDSDLFNSYPANTGDVSANASKLVLKYNNNKSSIYRYTNYETHKSEPLYYDDKLLNGEVKIDLSKITWSEESKINSNEKILDNKAYKTDTNYAKEQFLTDLKKDFNSNNITKLCNIEYYDKNNKILVYDNSVNKTDNIVKNMSLNSDILTINLHKNYQLNTTTPIEGDKPYTGILVYNQTEVNKINSAKLILTFYNDNYYYKINVKLDNFKTKSTKI